MRKRSDCCLQYVLLPIDSANVNTPRFQSNVKWLSGDFRRRQLVHNSRFSSQKCPLLFGVCVCTCSSATLARCSADASNMIPPRGGRSEKVRKENAGSECQQSAGN